MHSVAGAQLLGPDGRALLVALDHTAYSDVPVAGLEDVRALLCTLNGCRRAPDGVILPLGGVQHYADQIANYRVIASVDSAPPFGTRVIHRAIELGVDGIKCYLYPFSGDSTVNQTYCICADAAASRLPVIGEPFPGGMRNYEMRTAEHITAAARVTFETGASVIKSLYTGDIESMRSLVEYCAPVPILVLGGLERLAPPEFLAMVRDAVRAGCSGAAIGTNVFTASNPAGMVDALGAVIHEDMPVDKALSLID